MNAYHGNNLIYRIYHGENMIYKVYKGDVLIWAIYLVVFKDWDESILKRQYVVHGNSAVAPSNPTRDEYQFIGWSASFSNVTTKLTIVAQYEELESKLLTEDGNVIANQNNTALLTEYSVHASH